MGQSKVEGRESRVNPRNTLLFAVDSRLSSLDRLTKSACPGRFLRYVSRRLDSALRISIKAEKKQLTKNLTLNLRCHSNAGPR